MQVGFPFQIDGRGRLADPPYDLYVYELIEQLLFTSPGQRVNRPDFGCGLLELAFDPRDAEQVTATEFLIQSALQRWLGEIIEIERVTTSSSGESTLVVKVAYLLRSDRRRRVATFQPENGT